MLELGVDEITLVLQVAPAYRHLLGIEGWEDVAVRMIGTFAELAGFQDVYGERFDEPRVPQGYTMGYHYGDHPFYLATAFHEYQPDFGCIVKFSAQALDYYCEKTGMKAYQLVQAVESDLYTIRASRVDMTADYIDEGIDTSVIYQSLMDGSVSLSREYVAKATGETKYRRMQTNFRGIIDGQEVPTIYIGSPKSNGMLRIYNKKLEQIQRSGTKLEKARRCDDWVRFEGVFKNEYAHKLGEELSKVSNDDEFAELIAVTLLNKYRFMSVADGDPDGLTDYSQMLDDSIGNASYCLRGSTNKNYDLARSVAYVYGGSGIMGTFYKIKEIWGADAVVEFMEYLLDSLKPDYLPSASCVEWIKKHKGAYQESYPSFSDFISENEVYFPDTCR